MFGVLGAARETYNPLSIPWHTLYYPNGVAFQAQGYANNKVLNDGETIPDETTSGNDQTAPSAEETTLTYVASSNVNGRPAIRGADTSGDHPSYETTLGGQLPADAGGYSVVCVWNQGAQTASTFSTIFSETTGIQDNYTFLTKDDGSISFRIANVTYTPAVGLTPGTTYALRSYVTSANATAHIDATEVVNTGAGGDDLNGLALFMTSNTAHPFSGDLAFLGLYDGDVTGDAEWSRFKTWADNQFGCTI